MSYRPAIRPKGRNSSQKRGPVFWVAPSVVVFSLSLTEMAEGTEPPRLEIALGESASGFDTFELLTSCQRAFPSGSCVLVVESESGEVMRASLGSVSDQQVQVIVETDNATWERDLRFQSEDSRLEKSRTVGFSFGVMAEGLFRRAENLPKPANPEPKPLPPSTSVSAAPLGRFEIYGGPGCFVDPALGGPECGGNMRLSYQFPGVIWRIRGFFDSGFSSQSFSADSARIALGVGGEAIFLYAPISLGVAFDSGLEVLHLYGQGKSSDARVTPRLRVAGLGRLPLGADWFLGAELACVTQLSPTQVYLSGEEREQSSALGPELTFGLAYRF